MILIGIDRHWALIEGVLYKKCAVPKVDIFHVGGLKDLSVGVHGCGSGNPYHVRIVKLEILDHPLWALICNTDNIASPFFFVGELAKQLHLDILVRYYNLPF